MFSDLIAVMARPANPPGVYDRHSMNSPDSAFQTPFAVGERNELEFVPETGKVHAKNGWTRGEVVGTGKIIATFPGPMWGDNPTTTYRIQVTLSA